VKVELRNPNIVMKLSRLGSFHQSKLSFLRSFLKEFNLPKIKETSKKKKIGNFYAIIKILFLTKN